MKALVMLDFEPDVAGVAGQPFVLLFTRDAFGGKAKLHIRTWFSEIAGEPENGVHIT